MANEKTMDQLTPEERRSWLEHVANVLLNIWCGENGYDPVAVTLTPKNTGGGGSVA